MKQKESNKSEKKYLSALDDYINKVFVLVLLMVPGACQCAGLLYTFEKIMGWMPSVNWTALIIFDITCLFYLTMGIIIIKTGFSNGVVRTSNLKFGKVFLVIIMLIQFNFILYMIPATDFWGFAFYFVILTSFFLDYKMVAATSVEIAGSLVVSWFIHGDITLPAKDQYFLPNMLDRVVCVALSLPTIVLLTFLVNRFLVNAKKDELERNNARVQSVLETAQGLSEKLLGAGTALTDISQNESNSAASLSATSENLLMNSNELSRKADLSIANLNELKMCGSKLNQNVERVETTSRNLMQKSESNENVLNSLQSVNKEVVESMNITNEVAAKLSLAVKEIDGTLNVIHSIATTTNILALNASIEAVRAGEAGKSFSVVASEIGDLANNTQRSLSDIQDVITRVQDNVAEMTSYVNDNFEKLTLQNRYFSDVFGNMKEMNELLKESMDNINIMNEVYAKQNDIIRNTFDISEDIADSIRAENQEFNVISDMVGRNAANTVYMNEQVVSINQMALQIDELLKK